jgi:hypothetical protein
MTQEILQCLPLLADILGRAYGVAVEIGGTEAFTTGRVIRLPSLPAASDPTFLGLVRGYIDHEAAHIRHTDFEAMTKAAVTPLEKHIWNIFEDWRVEARLAEIFPGSGQNFHWLIRHLFQQPPAETRSSAYVILDWLLLTVRSWSVPELAPQCQEVAGRIDRLWPGLHLRLEPILAAMQDHCPGSMACLDYARHVVRTLSSISTDPVSRRRSAPPSATRKREEDHGDAMGQRDMPAAEVCASPAAITDLQSLVSATATELPEDLGQFLKRSIASEPTQLGRTAVAAISTKPVSPLSQQDLLEIERVTAGMRARLQGLLQATRLIQRRPSRRGKIDPRRLHAVTIGSQRVFLTSEPKPAINTAVHILLDSSSSMRTRIRLASQCCHVVAQALSQIGISVGVTAFPGERHASVAPLLRHGDRVHSDFLIDAGGGTPLSEAGWWVLQQLARLPEARKIVLIVTDGCPDNVTTTSEAIRAAEAIGIEVYGLGIDAPQIAQILPSSSKNIYSLQQLPSALFAMLQHALLHGRRAA